VQLVELLDLRLGLLPLLEQRLLLRGELAELVEEAPTPLQERLEPSFQGAQPLAVVALLAVGLLRQDDPGGHDPQVAQTLKRAS